MCVSVTKGSKHDFALFKHSKVTVKSETEIAVDSGYQGLQSTHPKTVLPKKNTKLKKLSKADKQANRALSCKRVLNENVIGSIKRFKIIADRYRNRRKRFGLRFNLIAGIYNAELEI